jgi:hypothetical protein
MYGWLFVSIVHFVHRRCLLALAVTVRVLAMGGILALNFNRRTKVEFCTSVDTMPFSPPIANTMCLLHNQIYTFPPKLSNLQNIIQSIDSQLYMEIYFFKLAYPGKEKIHTENLLPAQSGCPGAGRQFLQESTG